jgi:hypothetical protein
MRYAGIAAEAADEAMPPPEGRPQADIFDRLLESVSCCRVLMGVIWGARGSVGNGWIYVGVSCA